MAKTRLLQSNMTLGELSPDMWARVDSAIYFQGVARAQNVFIMPLGGLRRRPGLTKTKDSHLLNDGRMFAFEFSRTQDYVILLTPSKISVFHNGELMTTLNSPFSTMDQVKEVQAAQSGDVMVLTHQDTHPQMLRREGSHTSWALRNIPFVTIPTYDFGQGDEPVWSNARGWPGVCTFFQSRLWLAGSTQKPNSVWGSQINDFWDFDIGQGQADYAIFDTLDTDQFNEIVNLYPGRNLMVFTTGSEFYNTAEYITPTDSAWKRSTSYGSKRLRPVMIDGAVYFVDAIGRTVRESTFQFTEDSYTAPSISLLSNHLIKNVVSMDAVKGTNVDVSDFVYVVNDDGTVAVMNTSRVNKISGWTQWTTNGKFTDVCVVNKIVYFIVKRYGEYHLEYMNEGTVLDHNSIIGGTPPIVQNVTFSLWDVTHNGSNVIHQVPGSGTPVTEIDTLETPTQAAQPHKLILDDSIQQDTFGGFITLPRPAYKAETGYDVPLEVESMPLNVPLKDGNNITEVKRVVKVNLLLTDSLGVSANKKSAPDRKFTVVLDQAPSLFTGLKEIRLTGYDKVTQVKIWQENPLPFKLVGMGAEVKI